MDYIEIAVSVKPKESGRELLIAELSEIGFESFVDSESGFNAYIQKNNYSKKAIDELFLNYTDTLNIIVTETLIPQQNWNKEWESNFEPIDVVGKCYIRAPFHEAKKNYKYDIIIEPKMSFGTGHHQTTQLMIQQLMELDVKNQSLLDMGCGTGVLAIVASKMGANPITAIDIDEWSVENSIENFQKNNIQNVNVQKGNVKNISGKMFFSILANINKNTLLQDMSEYVQALENSGNLVMSGFFDSDVNELEVKAVTFGLRLKNKMVNSGWAMLHFIKR